MKSITIYALHLGRGGVETYVVSVANILATKYRVNIIVTYKLSSEAIYNFDDNVNIEYLIDEGPSDDLLKKAIKERKIISSLALFFKNVKILMMKYWLNYKEIRKDGSALIISTRIFHNRLINRFASKNSIKIATEHNHHNSNNEYINDLEKSISNFNYLIPISEELTQFYKNTFDESNLTIINIPFYVDVQDVKSDSKEPNYIYIGRLSSEKAVQDVIHTFNIIYADNQKSKLTIVGDGKEKTKLILLAETLNLKDAISFKGYLNKNAINELLKYQMFLLLTSLTESFGIVLLEAMSFGVIPIIFDTAQGGLEILKGFDNLIIPDRSVEKMALVAKEIESDEIQRKTLQEKLIQKSHMYDYNSMKTRWLNLIEDVLGNH